MRPRPKSASVNELAAKDWVPKPPLKRSRILISPAKKLRIILHFMHHRILADDCSQRQRTLAGLEWDGLWRPPTAKETASHFKIPERTARGIWYDRQRVIAMSRGSQLTPLTQRNGQYYELELELFRQFVNWRQMGRKVTQFWFQRRAKAIYQTMYPKGADSLKDVSIFC